MTVDHITSKLENIISGHRISADDADWLRAAVQAPAEAHRNEPIGHVTSFGDVGCTCDYVSPQKYRPPVGAPLYAIPPDLAADGERFRWLIDERNWNENEDTPSVCTSEDVHWGDKARALIDRHMKG